MLTKEDMDALLQEVLAVAGGNIELVARTALQELVKLKAEKLKQATTGAEMKRRGRPPKPGLRVPKEYRKAQPLDAPNKMGLSISTKECGEIGVHMREYSCVVTDEQVNVEVLADMLSQVKSKSDREVAEKILDWVHREYGLPSNVKKEENIKNIQKRIGEERRTKT